MDDPRPSFTIVGLPDTSVREARDRVRSGIRSAEFILPDRVVVNLAPATVRKAGAGFDLAIALAILAARGSVPPRRAARRRRRSASSGSTAPSGRRPGALVAAEGARRIGPSDLLCAAESCSEVALVEGVEPIPATCSSTPSRSCARHGAAVPPAPRPA